MGNGDAYYNAIAGDQYLQPMPFIPSSVSHPALLPSSLRTRSPSRISQSNGQGEVYFVNGPSVASSQSYSVPRGSFVDEFLASSSGQSEQVGGYSAMLPPTGGTPDFGDYTPHRAAATTGVDQLFKALENFVPPQVSFNFTEVVGQVLAERGGLTNTMMWTGLLTGTKLDKNYKILLTLTEKALALHIDETVRKLREDQKEYQLAVFVRRFWTALLPAFGEVIEKWICGYHKQNYEGFYKDVETDEWDAEDESREKQLDELDQELEDLQGEIEEWERIQRNYLSYDDRAALYLRSKKLFEQRILLLDAVEVDTSTKFLEGGSLRTPSLPEWEHPEVREKQRLRSLFQADFDEACISQNLEFDDSSMGIPPNGFCFEPGVLTDSKWDHWVPTTWEAIPMDTDLENIRPLSPPGDLFESPFDKISDPPRTHRPSLDALKAFD